MSVALVSMVRDEVDIVEAFVRHSAAQVDALIVADNLSSDGTREILDELSRELPLTVVDDPDPAYYQSMKMTQLGRQALAAGHSWSVFADADEIWYVADDPDRRIADYLDGLAPDLQIVCATLFNHIPSSGDDPNETNPFKRIGWRKREPAPLPKVCCRLHPFLSIDAGNHSARYRGRALRSPGLALRHFSWRTAPQYAHKIKIGRAAYAATNLPEDIGVHWRMWEGASDEQIEEHFRTWFWSEFPRKDGLIYDPAPLLD